MQTIERELASYIPKAKISGVHKAYRVGDGYFVKLNDGWCTETGKRAFYAKTIDEFRQEICKIKKIRLVGWYGL